MKEKIARVLDRILKRKIYICVHVHYDPATKDLVYWGDQIGAVYGSKNAAARMLIDRGYKKIQVLVRTHANWDVNPPYWKILWRKKDGCGDYFYADIDEEQLEW